MTIAFRPRPSRAVPDRAGTKLRDAELESRAVGYLPEGRLGDYLAPERSMKCHGIVTEQSPPCHGAVSAQSHYNPRNSHGIITAWSLQGYNADRSRRPSPAVEGWVGGYAGGRAGGKGGRVGWWGGRGEFGPKAMQEGLVSPDSDDSDGFRPLRLAAD